MKELKRGRLFTISLDVMPCSLLYVHRGSSGTRRFHNQNRCLPNDGKIYGVRFQDATFLTATTVRASSLASGKHDSFSVI
jgi:hypothetical protein